MEEDKGGGSLKKGASFLGRKKKCIPPTPTVRLPLLGDWLNKGVKNVKEWALIGYSWAFCTVAEGFLLIPF
jgi:hypothetical protein